MANRHLHKVGYTPSGGVVRGGQRLGAAAPNGSPPLPRAASGEDPGGSSIGGASAPTPSGGPPIIVTPSRPIWLETLIGLVPAFAIPAIVLVTKLAPIPVQTIYVPMNPPVAANEMQTISIKIERSDKKEAALRRLQRVTPQAEGLFRDWNGGGRRKTIGHAPDDRPYAFYIPEPRPGFETQFQGLQHAGFEGIRLAEIHIPQSWSKRTLDLYLYKWATDCKVKVEWIAAWSSFRPVGSVDLENECRPGGTCLIVTRDCREDAFEDFDSFH